MGGKILVILFMGGQAHMGGGGGFGGDPLGHHEELRKLHTWLVVNQLSLNISKTNFIVFHP